MVVLVCDDSAFMRGIIKSIIRPYVEIIIEACDGVEALNKYKEHHPNLVFMDITMPRIDGLRALENIKLYDKKAKVVMCSAMGQKYMVVESIRHGAIDFITKPFNSHKLTELVQKYK